MTEPYINIDLEKIEHNARKITRLCQNHGIEVTGVTKATCGNPNVAAALLQGGVTSLGESRMRNIHRLKANGINSPFVLLRIPSLSEAEQIVTSVDISLNSELSVIAALSEAACERGLIHDIILMLDLGDLREGILPADLFSVSRDVIELEGVRIVGLGTNLSCYGGVIPTEENMQLLEHYANELEARFHLKLRYVSGGNSSALNLIASGKMPKKINNIRIGEGILLGRETISRKTIPGTYPDVFLLKSEIIELKRKPSVPIGEIGEDAFGNRPEFVDKGEIQRAIFNIGREDVDVDGIVPTDSRIKILGASSDHLLADVSATEGDIRLGDKLEFSMNYAALLAVMTSEYVEKRYYKHRVGDYARKKIELIGLPTRNMDISTSQNIRSILAREFAKMNVCVTNNCDLALHSTGKKNGREIGGAFSAQSHPAIQTAEKIAQQVESAYLEHRTPIIIAPAPPASLGVHTGISRTKNPTGLVIFSAYGGFAAPEDKNSPDINRMMLGAALGYGDEALAETGGNKPKFMAENVVLIGLRNLSHGESRRINQSRIKVFTMENIDALGMKEVCHRAIRLAGMGTSGLHVTFDLSVMDSRELPGILCPTIGGISYREAHLAMEILSLSGLLRSADITGFTPEKDINNLTASAVASFLLSLFGKRILGRKDCRN